MRKRVYVISGLGADSRVFINIKYGGLTPVFIEWIKPHVNESIKDYAFRLSKQVKDSNPIIIGLSFGGIMAIEIARQIQISNLILIASAKTKSEIPFYFKWIGKLNLHKIIPVKFFKQSNALTYYFFGAKTDAHKKLLKQILIDTDPIFLKWAINEVLHWKNEVYLPDITHIHGSKDRILPLKFINADIIINGGGHFMTLDKYKQINQEIERILRAFVENNRS